MMDGTVVVRIKVAVDTHGLRSLRKAIQCAEELEDLASWRPGVKELSMHLRRAISRLRIETR